MQFMNMAGAWAFLALAAILFLYILKQRLEPLEVSSTYLWRMALHAQEADRPFQKLRRNLLLLLQLLLALFLALALMRPMTLGDAAGELIFVFDLSASMQAEDGDGARLDKAVQDAKRRVDGLPDGARVSVLAAGQQVRQPLTRSQDSLAAKRALDSLAAENGGADLEGALSLSSALQKELEGAQVVVYTDQDIADDALVRPALGGGVANRAILSLQANRLAAVARVANYGPAAEITVECSADGVLCDVRTLSLEAGEIASVQFDLPAEALVVEAEITSADGLMGDNTRIWVSRDTGSTTVTLAGRNNVFLEKVLGLRQDVSVVKTTPEEVGGIQPGALTVLDGPLPDALPQQGALLLIDPDGERVGDVRGAPTALEGAYGTLASQLNEYLTVEEIQVARWKPVTGGAPIWMAGEEAVLSIFQEGSQRVAVLGFDLHDSNLPLLKEFPIFMQQLLAYLAPEPLGAGLLEADCGDTLAITPQSFAVAATVVTPSGRRVPIDMAGTALSDTLEMGVYRLLQVDDAGQETAIPFALHIPAAESNVQHKPSATEGAASEGSGIAYGREWTPLLILFVLAILLLEWGVYRRGY